MAGTSEHGLTRTPQAAGPAPAALAVLPERGARQRPAALPAVTSVAAAVTILVVAGILAGVAAVAMQVAVVLAADTLEEEAPEAVAATGKIVRSERSR